jgi:hypothetical protein
MTARVARQIPAQITEGLARPTCIGRALATHDIPIEGRDEWLAAAGAPIGMKNGYLRGALVRPATPRQQNVLAAYVAAGGS